MQDCVAYYGDDQFTTITWYGSSPYYIPECGVRDNFYGVSGIPDARFDGYTQVLGGMSSGSYIDAYGSHGRYGACGPQKFRARKKG